MEHSKCKLDSKSEIMFIDDERRIPIKENFVKPKTKKDKKKVTKTMEFKKSRSESDPEIIMIDDREPIKTERKFKKPKTKKHKRKVKLGNDYNNDTETLYITQTLKVKKTKFSCVININNVSKKKKRCRSSIIRPARNECKREAYYNRIVPMCMRNNCVADNLFAMNRCRTEGCRYFHSSPMERKSELKHNAPSKHMTRYKEEYRIKEEDLIFETRKAAGLSPVSSSPLAYTDSISYEDVSDNSFSSEDELDTLIKRTKEREHQFMFPMKAHAEPLFSTSITNEDIASTGSGASLHSTSTMVLPPVETEAYSPTTSPDYRCNVIAPDSPTFTSKITMENISEAIERPYSPSDPTNTLITNEDDYKEECEVKNVKAVPYSLASPVRVKIEVDHENNGRHIVDCMPNVRDVKSEINGTNHMIKIEDIKREEESASEDYLNNAQIFETDMNINNNIAIKSEIENEYDINENFKLFVKVEKP